MSHDEVRGVVEDEARQSRGESVLLPRASRVRAWVALATLVAATLGTVPAAALDFRPVEITIGAAARSLHWGRRDGDELIDLFVLVGARVVCYRQTASGFSASETISLPDEPCLVDFAASPIPSSSAAGSTAPSSSSSGERIIVLTNRGVLIESPSAANDSGTEGYASLARVRGIPQPLRHFAVNALTDFTGDGSPDLLIPTRDGFELYRNSGGTFERELRLRGDTKVVLDIGGPELLRPLRTGITIPNVQLKDLNGDGRVDIAAKSGNRTLFYVQRDGRLPTEPSYVLDLSRWEEPAARQNSSLLGRGGSLRVDEKDIDGDGRTDYLITSGQKIRVFFGTEDGAQFERPDILLKVSDDLLGVLGLDVDEDGLTDLVALKFRMPGISKILAALFVSMSFDLEVLGYRNLGSRKFARRPTHRNRIVFKLPAILDLVDEIDDLTKRFFTAATGAARLGGGDVDGDGRPDAVFLEETAQEEHRLRVFLARPDEKTLFEDFNLGPLLFDPTRQEFTVEDVIDFVANASHASTRKALEGRRPDAEISVAGDYDIDALEIDVRDLDADGKGEIVVRWTDEKIVVFRRG